jgi:hypothetical protein
MKIFVNNSLEYSELLHYRQPTLASIPFEVPIRKQTQGRNRSSGRREVDSLAHLNEANSPGAIFGRWSRPPLQAVIVAGL